MSEFTITCDRCKQPVGHVCNETFAEALMDLLTWVPEHGVTASEELSAAFKAASKSQLDECDFTKMPFFGSQVWSYLIWYKDEARTFHGLLAGLIQAAGLDPHKVRLEAAKKARDRRIEEHASYMGSCRADIKRYTRKIERADHPAKTRIYQGQIDKATMRLVKLERVGPDA